MATLQPILPVDEMMKKLEALENKEPPKGGKEKKNSPAMGRVAHSTDSERDKEKGEASPKSPEETSERKIFEKREDFKKEEEFSETPPKIWEEKWRELVDFTRARNPILGSFLALGNLIHLSDEKVEIGFDKDSFHYERMLERENRTQLESICHEYLQKKTKVVISALNQEVGSKGRVVLNRGEATRNELERRSEKGESENPVIQEALRLFNGKIVEG
jgi:RNase P/RNase MRP subunit p29